MIRLPSAPSTTTRAGRRSSGATSDDGLGLALWGLGAAVLFVAALGSWQLAPPRLASGEIARLRLPPGDPAELTASIPKTGTPALTEEEPAGWMREAAELRRTLAALARDQEETARRLAALDQQVALVTGSVKRSPAPISPTPPVAGAPVASTTPAPTGDPASARISTRPLDPATPVARFEPSTEAPPRTEFGVDIGSFRSLTALKGAWNEFTTKQADLAAGLSPLVVVNETANGLELRLVAGPFVNAADAAKHCARLRAVTPTCTTTAFIGQPIGHR